MIRKIEKGGRKLGSSGRISGPVPVGISPVLRASWRFAQDVAERFNRELTKDRSQSFLKKLIDRFI